MNVEVYKKFSHWQKFSKKQFTLFRQGSTLAYLAKWKPNASSIIKQLKKYWQKTLPALLIHWKYPSKALEKFSLILSFLNVSLLSTRVLSLLNSLKKISVHNFIISIYFLRILGNFNFFCSEFFSKSLTHSTHQEQDWAWKMIQPLSVEWKRSSWKRYP